MAIVKQAKVGKAEVKMGTTPRGFAVAVNEGGQRRFYEEGDDADRLWMIAQDAAARLNPLFVGYDGARKRFLHFFPQGFRGADYEGEERNYKLKAKAKLDAGAPLERAASEVGFGDIAASAYQATNVLSPFEKAKLIPILRGPDGDRFIQAAAAFGLGDKMAA